jgi:hypothetical protein
MRSMLLSALIIVIGVGAFAQAAQPTKPITVVNPNVVDGIRPHPPAPRCCHEKVWDKGGKEIGDLVAYDNSYGPQPLIGWLSYRLKGGDAVLLRATPEALYGLQPASGGSVALFTTPDCSGPTMFAQLAWPPLAKRYAMVLLVGPNAYTSATNAWLFVTPPLPSRAIPGPGTVFHSQWSDGQPCQVYPPPGYVVNNGPGGYWMSRVEDLYAKFKRPFYIDY